MALQCLGSIRVSRKETMTLYITGASHHRRVNSVNVGLACMVSTLEHNKAEHGAYLPAVMLRITEPACFGGLSRQDTRVCQPGVQAKRTTSVPRTLAGVQKFKKQSADHSRQTSKLVPILAEICIYKAGDLGKASGVRFNSDTD